MVAVTHRAFRELLLEFGCLDLAWSEMASAGSLISSQPYETWYLDPAPAPEKLVYQFYATKPEHLPAALRLVGAPHPSGNPIFGAPVFGVDLNFGCAAPHITRAGGGAALMREPEKAFALARLARAAWTRNLSAKLRMGPEEDYEALKDFCLGLVEAGIDFLTLHPRLEGEKFRRKSRWEYVGRLAAELPVPVLGNGDVRSPEDCAARFAETGAAGIMIGREAVRRPWLFALIRGREKDSAFELEVDREALAQRFLDLVEARLPPDFRLTRARRFFFYYAEGFSFAHHLKWPLQNAPDLPAMRAVLGDYFREVPGDRVLVERPGA
jgi:tRNA-dihydrouridine synthase